jgi:Ser/Thr protein kinase RdoA (MazF antagonist)
MVFKINWEKSQTQHQLPKGMVEKMLSIAYPNKELKSSQIIAGGCANLNFKIEFEGKENPVILRIHLRDKRSSYLEKNIGILLKKDLPVPQIHYIGEVDNYCFSIAEFMEGITLRDLIFSKNIYNLSAIMYEIGSLLAKTASHKFESSGFFNENLEIIEELGSDSLKEFSLSCLDNKNVKQYLQPEIIEKIRLLLADSKASEDKNINLVHADFDPANILVAEVDGIWRVSAILDWEFAYSGSWLNDVANILRCSHEMPNEYKDYFLKGISDNKLELPEYWQDIVNEYNLASMLDSMTRHDLEKRPNIREDLCDLISHIVSNY